MRQFLLAGGLAAALVACSATRPGPRDTAAVPAPTADDPVTALVEFQTHQSDGGWLTFCRGITTAGGTATVEHCVEAASKRLMNGERLRLHNPWSDRALETTDVPLKEGPAYAVTDSGSTGLDFVLIAAKAGGPIAAIRRRAFPTASLVEGVRVTIGYDRSNKAQCAIKAVCGSRIHYMCSGGTEGGWSGSPVFADLPTGRVLVGLHDQIVSTQDSLAISWNTVLGRIKVLRSDELADKIGQQSDFNHRWTVGQCTQEDPTPPIVSTQLTRLFASGLAARDGTSFWIYDNDELCKVAIARPEMNRCANYNFGLPNGITGVNRVQGIGGDRLVVMAGTTKAGENSKVVVTTPINSGDGLQYTNSEVITTDLEGVYAAASYDGQLILGGEDGFCVVRGANCRRAHKTPFHVNDIARLPDGRIAAIGRYRIKDKGTVGYCMTAALGADGLSGFKACHRLPTTSALRSPVAFRGRILVASSEGAIYALRADGGYDKAAIPNLPGDGIEDAIRSMAKVSDNTLAIVGSDGSMRLLAATNTSPLSFAASPDRAVFDRAIWLTDLLVGPGWILVRGQDNQIHKITGF